MGGLVLRNISLRGKGTPGKDPVVTVELRMLQIHFQTEHQNGGLGATTRDPLAQRRRILVKDHEFYVRATLQHGISCRPA